MDENAELSIRNEILIQEYSAVIQKMSSNESWAVSFVALYFAFLASIGTASGFIAFSILKTPKTSDFGIGITVEDFRPYLLIALVVLAVFLTVWAVFMVVDYKRETKILLRQVSWIEKKVYGEFAQHHGFATQLLSAKYSKSWKYGESVVVGSVFIMFFISLGLLIVFSLAQFSE